MSSMRFVLPFAAALAFAGMVGPAFAQTQFNTPVPQQPANGEVQMCLNASGQAVPCGGPGNPSTVVSGPVAWQAPAVSTIAAANTYQVLFPAGAATHGGFVTNTCAVGSNPLYVDVTGATGTTLSAAAQPIYPAAATGSAPGSMRFPGTTAAVTIYGPSGCAFKAYGG